MRLSWQAATGGAEHRIYSEMKACTPLYAVESNGAKVYVRRNDGYCVARLCKLSGEYFDPDGKDMWCEQPDWSKK